MAEILKCDYSIGKFCRVTGEKGNKCPIVRRSQCAELYGRDELSRKETNYESMFPQLVVDKYIPGEDGPDEE